MKFNLIYVNYWQLLYLYVGIKKLNKNCDRLFNFMSAAAYFPSYANSAFELEVAELVSFSYGSLVII